MAPIVGFWFSSRAHYNEFVENGPKVGLWWGDDLFWGWKIHKIGWPNVPGRKTPRPRTGTPNSSRIPGASLLFLGLLLLFSFFALGDLCCYISLSSVHPPPTLVSHPCPYSSARPIGHSFWLSMSCCGPYRTVQGSHPHQRVRVLAVGI